METVTGKDSVLTLNYCVNLSSSIRRAHSLSQQQRKETVPRETCSTIVSTGCEDAANERHQMKSISPRFGFARVDVHQIRSLRLTFFQKIPNTFENSKG